MRKALWFLGRGLFFIYYRLCFRFHIEGREHLPAAGPAILFANHFSWNDIPVIGCASTRWLHYMAKDELFRVPVLGPTIRFLGAFPVKRGTADRQAIKHALAVLKAGHVLGIFPEGTRSKTGHLLKPEPGLAYLVWKSGAPAVPAGISSRYRWFGRITVRIGQPVPVDLPEKVTGDDLAALSEQLMEAVRTLLIPEQMPPPRARERDAS